MSLMQRGAEALIRRMKQSAGVSVTYTRGGTSRPLTPWVGRTLFARNAAEPNGAAVVWGDRDYLIAAADFAAAGFGVPAVGDTITEVIDGTAVTFAVSRPDTNEPAWRYSDQSRQVLRLHTKRV